MRIALAGAESPENLRALLKVKPPNLLMSYYYLRKQKDLGRSVIDEAKSNGAWIMVDSGAHSFFVKFPWLDPRGDKFLRGMAEEVATQKAEFEGKYDHPDDAMAAALQEMDEYHDGYYKWAEQFYPSVDTIAELDIGPLVGDAKVEEWREGWYSRKLKVIHTPHGSLANEIKEYIRLCNHDMVDFVASSGGGGKEGLKRFTELFNKILPTLRKTGTKIHGWALTNVDAFRKLPLYSVDSTTWLTGATFGVTFHYMPGDKKMKAYGSDNKGARKKFKDDCQRLGIDHAALCADKTDEVNEWNAHQWKMLANDMMTDTSNAYWLSDEEKTSVVLQAREVSGFDKQAVLRNLALIPARPRLRVGEDPRLELGRVCNSCFINDRCPQYEGGAACSISFRPQIDTPADVMKFLGLLIEQEGERVNQALFVERVKGGYLDEAVSKEMDRFFKMSLQLKELMTPIDTPSMRKKTSVLENLFGSLLSDNPSPTAAPAIDILVSIEQEDGIIEAASNEEEL